MVRLSLLMLLGPLACTVTAAGGGTLAGEETPFVPGIRIVRSQDAKARALAGRLFSFPFGDSQDGTKLVLDFLDEAKQAGALAVGDIRILHRTQRRGRWLACQTKLVPFAKRHDYTVPRQVPGRTEATQVLRPVTRTVTEHEYRCRMVSQPVTRTETVYSSQYDYYSKSYRTVPQSRTVTRYEMKNECRSEPVTRTVTRYEYQTETKYIPPRVEYLAAHYTDFDLIETRPTCEETLAPAAGLPHQIIGTIYHEVP